LSISRLLASLAAPTGRADRPERSRVLAPISTFVRRSPYRLARGLFFRAPSFAGADAATPRFRRRAVTTLNRGGARALTRRRFAARIRPGAAGTARANPRAPLHGACRIRRL